MTERPGLGPFIAPIFVLLWGTGFVGAKFGLPYAEPMTFLTIRFALAAASFGGWAFLAGEFRGGHGDARGAVVVGALIHTLYLGGVFTAIWRGADAGLVALIVSMQPVATALMARGMLGEVLSGRQWLGMGLGIGGVALVVSRKMALGGIDAPSVGLCVLALVAISYASIVQKRRAVAHGFAADNAVQFSAAALAGGAALLFETGRVDWTPEFIAALGWMTAALSIGAVSILYALLRCGGASSVASLFFLVPGVTALLAWAMFGETFGAVELAGLLTAMAGVYLVTRQPRETPCAAKARSGADQAPPSSASI